MNRSFARKIERERDYRARHHWPLPSERRGGLAGTGASLAGTGGNPTLVLLGDSLSVGAGSWLKKEVPDAVVIAKVGAHISWGATKVAEINALHPSRVLVMLGTNDIPGTSDVRALAKRLDDTVVSQISAPVTVGLIPPMPAYQSRVDAYNDALRDRFDTADIGGVISTSELADGVHPGPHGYQNMAAAWVEAEKPGPSLGTLILGSIAIGAAYGAYRYA